MYSMTGFGRGESKEGGVELTVEIKTVNNRYLDVTVKSPRVLSAQEENQREREKEIRLDESAAKAYVAAAEKVAKMFKSVQDDLTVTNVLRFPDVIKTDDAVVADDEIISALNRALTAALEKLNAMRLVEGEKLKKDMLSRMDTIEGLVEGVEKRADKVTENYRVKLEARMKKVLENVEVDEGRLLTEVALFADKSNIDEELTRLHSHISQFRDICKEPLVGRKLDFLVQEFNRETNTICSKSNDLEVTRFGLALKNEIEKVREQVQNIE